MKFFYGFNVTILLLAEISHAASNTTTTPSGCRTLNTDVDWPSAKIWEEALPGVKASNGSDRWGPIPDYRLQAKSVEDVQKAVLFAKKHNIRLTVLTTGHDQQARADAGSGLLIDLSLFQGAHVWPSYTPTKKGLPLLALDAKPNVITPIAGVQAAVSFGPAVAGLPLNLAVSPSGLFTVSGGAGTVAVGGGWGQNGGYGPLTAQYGLGVDQWLEALIVTPDGELRVANSEVNTDLFWAIRGGGGGTFGIVVQATWKAHPTVPITGFNWYINSTLNDSDSSSGVHPISSALQYLLGQLPALHEKGISGTFYVHPTTIRGHTIHPGDQAGIAEANAVMGPILERMQAFPNMTPFQTRPFEFGSYREFFEGTFGSLEAEPTTPDARRNRGVIPYDSRLLSAEHLTSPNLIEALRETGGDIGVQLMAPGRNVGDGSDVAANPGWRKAVAFVIANKTNKTSADGLRKLAPDMGTYINEASVTEENWTSSFWGCNYPRLSELKSKYDPHMTLWVSPGINADHMHIVDGRACLVSPTPQTPSKLPPQTDRWHPVDFAADRHFIFGEQEIHGTTYPAPGTEIGLQPAA